MFQVGHVQKVSLVPGKVHEMRTLSLKPLLFGEKQFRSPRMERVLTHLHHQLGL